LVRRPCSRGLIADGDMHLKNMALLKVAEPGDVKFRSEFIEEWRRGRDIIRGWIEHRFAVTRCRSGVNSNSRATFLSVSKPSK
jgi:hypothetical protein